MDTTLLRTSQSVGESAQRSSAAQAPGNRDGSITVAELIDRYMAAYSGKDGSRMQRLSWWQAKLGSHTLATVQDDDIFHAIEELAAQRGRYYAGRDADDRPIYKAKGKPYAPATLNRFQVSHSAHVAAQ